MVIILIWLLSGFLATTLALLAALRVRREWVNESMRYLLALLLGSALYSGTVVYVAAAALAVVRSDGSVSIGIMLLTAGHLASSLTMDAFALKMLGAFEKP